MLIDSHCHLSMSQFDDDRDEVLVRAGQAGVVAVVDIGIDVDSGRKALELSAKHENVYTALGFHPHYADRFDAGEFWALWERGGGKVVGLGEIGLDYYRDLSKRENQRVVFEALAAKALELGVPVIIHVREAMPDALDILGGLSGEWSGIMHCFSGDMNDLEKVLGLGLHVSIPGPVTYPKNQELRRVVKECPKDRLLIETDAPFLSPQGFRGRRNEPAYLVHTADKVAQVWDMETGEAAAIVTENTLRLFGIKLKTLARSQAELDRTGAG